MSCKLKLHSHVLLLRAVYVPSNTENWLLIDNTYTTLHLWPTQPDWKGANLCSKNATRPMSTVTHTHTHTHTHSASSWYATPWHDASRDATPWLPWRVSSWYAPPWHDASRDATSRYAVHSHVCERIHKHAHTYTHAQQTLHSYTCTTHA